MCMDYFKSGYEVVILFDWWRTNTIGQYIASCGAVTLICMFSCLLRRLKNVSESVEFLEAYRNWENKTEVNVKEVIHDMYEETPFQTKAPRPHSRGVRGLASYMTPHSKKIPKLRIPSVNDTEEQLVKPSKEIVLSTWEKLIYLMYINIDKRMVYGLLIFFTTAIDFAMMLVSMTYNIGLFFAICAGYGLGSVLFKAPSAANDLSCH